MTRDESGAQPPFSQFGFVNADLIAAGLLRADFAWESTLSGLTYAKRIRAMKELGYHVEIIYLQLASPRLALKRIAGRLRQGGHNVQKADVLRRFSRSWHNFQRQSRRKAPLMLQRVVVYPLELIC